MGKAGVTIGAFVAMWVLFQAAPVMAAPVCSPEQVDLRGDFGTARFSVAVADDPRERAQGLMHVDRMARSPAAIRRFDARTVRQAVRTSDSASSRAARNSSERCR